jgi:hypothetical protein
MTGRPNSPEGLASTRSTSARAGGRNPVFGAFNLRAIGLLAIVAAIWGAPGPARADCEVTDTGIPDEAAFKIDPGGGRQALAKNGIQLSGTYYGESFGNWGGLK